MGREANSQFLLSGALRKQEGTLLAEQGLGELRTLPFALCLASPSSDMYGNNTWFCTAPRSLGSRGWSRRGRWGWQALRLGQLGSFTHSNRIRVLPRLGGSPRMRPTGHCPLGVTGHRRLLGGGSRSQNHERLCPDFAPSAIAGAGLPLPSTLLPLGCISAHPSAVIPARCAENGERSRPCSLFELQLGKAPGYPPAQPEMLTYSYRRGSPEVPASGGTLLRGRSWKDTPASRSEPYCGSALCLQPLFNPYIPYNPPTSTAPYQPL